MIEIGGDWVEIEESSWEACCYIQMGNDEDLDQSTRTRDRDYLKTYFEVKAAEL